MVATEAIIARAGPQDTAAPPRTDGAPESSARGDENAIDVALLKRIAGHHDRTAMRQLYERYHVRVRSFLRRLTDNDAVIDETYNDVMLRVWDKAGQFRDESRASSWIFSIAYRRCLRVLQSERSKRSLIDRFMQQPATPPQTPDTLVEDEELVAHALKNLNAKHRMVIELAYFEGYSTEEISRIARCPAGTVKTRLHHARERIRHVLHQLTSTPAVASSVRP